ncbi:MAG: [protein-PII] uridylyltransferase family protein [Coriobacteriia bacterium]
MLPRSHIRPNDLVHFLRERDSLLTDAAPGISPARHLAHYADKLFAALAAAAADTLPARMRWALVATGGYGAGALLPSSDLDVLILAEAPAAVLRPFVEAIFYPLWDAGLTVGHQVRSPRDHLAMTKTDTTVLTATLTARVIAGDVLMGDAAIESVAVHAAKRPAASIARIRTRERSGSPYLLEPDLKEGAGGRRDLDELVWTAAIVSGRPCHDCSPLVEAGVLSPAELAALRIAEDTTAAARWLVHRAGPGNTMTREIAEEPRVAALPFQDALATTDRMLRLVRGRLAGKPDAPAWPLTPDEVFGYLDSDPAALEDAAFTGRLEVLLPGFRELMTLRRPGLAHTLTVGAHSIATAAALLQPAGEVAARSAAAIAAPRPLQLAALVHDAGKAESGPGHAERGAALARGAAVRFGMAQAADDVTALVGLHLLLAETAARADLDDEDSLLRCARVIGRRELLAPLHLLTVADSTSTGPGAWSEWHDALVGKLVARLDSALSPYVDGAGIADSAERVRSSALAIVRPDTAEAEFVRRAPLRYLAGREASRVAREAVLVARLANNRAPGAYELEVATGPLEGTHVLSIAAPYTRNLFARIAGVIALTGLDILAAEAVTTGSGPALQTFTVHPATGADAGPHTWARLERSLAAALLDRFSLRVRLAERRRHYRPGRIGALEAEILPDPFAAVLRIQAPDRVGLLYDVARAVDDAGLHISSVTATTRDSIVLDTFRLIDADGGAPADAGLLGKLMMHLREIG